MVALGCLYEGCAPCSTVLNKVSYCFYSMLSPHRNVNYLCCHN